MTHSSPPKWFDNINRAVFGSTVLLIVFFLALVLFVPNFEALTNQIKAWITTSFSWFYVLSVAFFLIFLLFIACSQYGKIKLGPDHSQPDYSNRSWFAMLFTAGMGIGLMFFGVAEPLMHYISPPVGDAQTVNAAQQAMRVTFFHWGLHAWAIYAVVGLSLAYFAYRHHLPLKIRSALYPIIGQRIHGGLGHAADTFATLGTIFGVATSLGFGVLQINSGLNALFGIEQNQTVQIILILGISAIASMSVFLGLDKGIKRLSEFNLFLAIFFLAFVFLTSSSIYLLQTTIQNAGNYISHLFSMTFNLYAYQSDGDWIGGWTILYWAWWISWSPFVGMFIARVSRGRSIREFITGVLFVPTGFTIVWMGFLGNAGLASVLQEGQMQLLTVVQNDSSMALFEFLAHRPWATLMSGVATLLVLLFFVTSADSGALVADYLTAKHENSPVWQRLFWTVIIAILAIVLLLAGGLAALQATTIISALPFTVVMLMMCWGLSKALHLDALKINATQQARITPRAIHNPRSWQQRLGLVMHYPHQQHEVEQYIEQHVRPVFEQLAEEFKHRHLAVDVHIQQQSASLVVHHQHELNFVYKVMMTPMQAPSFMQEQSSQQQYYQAEVFLGEGGQNYDVMQWTNDDLLQDIIDQYERHLYFLNVVRS
ncbi:MAG: choline BCCT transporter BetT [Acinetobacter sp.]|nr:choline BCCT transporter BetT [Acinetobacter sp.]